MERMEDDKVNIELFGTSAATLFAGIVFGIIFPNLKLVSTFKPGTCDTAVQFSAHHVMFNSVPYNSQWFLRKSCQLGFCHCFVLFWARF